MAGVPRLIAIFGRGPNYSIARSTSVHDYNELIRYRRVVAAVLPIWLFLAVEYNTSSAVNDWKCRILQTLDEIQHTQS
jgi:hypothetical protein